MENPVQTLEARIIVFCAVTTAFVCFVLQLRYDILLEKFEDINLELNWIKLKEKEGDELLYTARSLVLVRETSCQRNGLNRVDVVKL